MLETKRELLWRQKPIFSANDLISFAEWCKLNKAPADINSIAAWVRFKKLNKS